MRIGDKVRFMRSKGEGIIRRMIDQSTVEVEIEDDFLIPVLKSEIVIISQEEGMAFREKRFEPQLNEQTIEKTQGLYLAFIPFNDKQYSLTVVNVSSMDIFLSISKEEQNKFDCIFANSVASESFGKAGEFNIADFDHWPALVIQALYYKHGKSLLKDPLNKKLKFKANSFFKSKQQVPLLHKEGFLFRLDEENISFTPEEIRDRMFESNAPKVSLEKIIQRPPIEVDLHVEKLVTNPAALSPSEMLDLQIKSFEKSLENALATGMEEIIFIHGAGNGVLKNHIHKYLSGNKEIKFFKDARKEKFGYGATEVRLK
ncbi:MAG TPA: DUF2027 domain-containing protein [Cytophagaceae bacterium]|nr:DUF2027 domain-containing protein [Cytophagaceae bacterium]